ncbi:MAG TPA: porphobilinogen synthase [Candidatus Thermoplasmatota archaeon]|nr:porphobilinogen synthase [Candidatus Thermoplasmatota archaeon]
MTRMRRLRRTPALRELAAQTHLRPAQLIQPHFVVPAAGARMPVASLPGIDRVGPDRLVEDVGAGMDLGLRTVLLFGVPDQKDPHGKGAADPRGPVPQAVRRLRDAFGPALTVMTDVCLCAYTTHGHCGLPDAHGEVRNDGSLPALAAMALCHAEAGADWVAPSDMMDGRVAHLRHALDAAGLEQVAILSYAAKYASGYYGPFREAAHSAPAGGDRRGYQMDPRNAREAVREILLDEAEGADAVMVKPALAYLDIVAAARQATRLPLACYSVSGEYAMVKAAARAGLVEEAAIVRENLTAMARAGADWIVTYHAREALQEGWLE